MTNGGPLISLVLPTFNRCQLVGRAIESVLAQSYRDFELVVIDDASTDDTRERIRTLADARIVALRHEHGRGAGAARNTGIRHARGRWITFLDDDDELLPSSLQKIAAFVVQRDGEIDFTWGGIERWPHPAGSDPYLVWPSEPADALAHLKAGTGYALTVRRRALELLEGFDESLAAGVDFDFLIRLGQRCVGAPIPDVLVRVHQHPGARLTDPTPGKAIAFERIADKHTRFLALHPQVGSAFWIKAAKLAYAVGRRRSGRRLLLRAVGTRPFSWRHWKTLLCLEVFGTEDLGLRRRLRFARWHG